MHKIDMRNYIFADRSTFRGIIKNEAANIVLRLYDFYPKLNETFNNQEELESHISTAVQKLIHKGDYLKGGCDELGRTNNLAHPAIKDLSIFVYKNIAHELSVEFENMIPCKIVALAAAAIKCCLDAWQYGSQKRNLFTAEEYGPTYNGILALFETLKQDPYHSNKFTNAQRAWAREAKLQTRTGNKPFEATNMELCLD
ncbi:hypothetical protein BGY98DRAFT_1041821 [Russula aff. rugulosa BPL654]|nr:hypothetical protein BGY98DRAFT_1041821 [Russula aff. rugulosa BPL654]